MRIAEWSRVGLSRPSGAAQPDRGVRIVRHFSTINVNWSPHWGEFRPPVSAVLSTLCLCPPLFGRQQGLRNPTRGSCPNGTSCLGAPVELQFWKGAPYSRRVRLQGNRPRSRNSQCELFASPHHAYPKEVPCLGPTGERWHMTPISTEKRPWRYRSVWLPPGSATRKLAHAIAFYSPLVASVYPSSSCGLVRRATSRHGS
jgi:hypothetical protein